MFTQKKSQSHQFTARQTLELEIGWGDQNQFVFDKALRVHPPSAGWAFYQSERHFAFEQKPNNLARVAAMQRDLHAGILFEEDSEQTRENILCDRCRRTQGQFSRRFTILRDEFSLGFGN